jgi:molybdopterin synthase sulfur carrier subunit
MATVFIPAMWRDDFGGLREVSADGATVGEVVEALAVTYPGIKEKLTASVSVAVDGEVTPLGLLEAVEPDSEIHFVPAIRGGLC